jgi:phospholipid transport system substrate-binding protein
MHRIAIAVAGLAFVLTMAVAPPSRSAQADEDAAGFITRLGDQTLALLQARDRSIAERQQKFEQLADQAFDIPKIARYVLGRYWLAANDNDRQQFGKAFEHYMVQVYWQHFSDYTGATFKVLGQKAGGQDTTVVTTEVARASGQPPAKVEWSVARQPDGYKVADVSIEGISQALTYRQEFSSIIERNNGRVSALTAELRQKTNG